MAVYGSDSSNSGRWAYAGIGTYSNPGSKNFRTNSATLVSVNVASFSTEDINSNSYRKWWDALVSLFDSGSTIYLQITEVGANYNLAIYEVTAISDQTTYFDIALSGITGSSIFEITYFGPTGATGIAGATGPQGPTGPQGTRYSGCYWSTEYTRIDRTNWCDRSYRSTRSYWFCEC